MFSEEDLSKRKRQLPLRLMQCLPKAPSTPVQRRSEAIKAEAILEGQLGGRLVGVPSATCIWTNMTQVTLVALSLSMCGNSHQECVLRLKRWLQAGLDDEAWPKHRMRSHHVQIGGKGMVDFADGLPEAELDTQLEAWLKKG